MAGGRVSANLLSILGVAPALGRPFIAPEEQPGHRVVILSHELWVSDFASSPNIIGQTVKVSDESSIIVGVSRRAFTIPLPNWHLFGSRTRQIMKAASQEHRCALGTACLS